tara:strand:+ start:2188 stop:3198 length:1011 start_codon:yes stop_codon:yes gene_type:complete
MIKYIFLLLPLFAIAQNDFFKYATFYTSMSINTSMVEDQDYIAVDKGYLDVTEVNPYDYNLTIGLRKIARFDYEYKVKTWYYGTEKAVADNVTIGNSVGWEYLFNYSFIRNRGDKFTNSDFWLRYLGERCVTKAQIKNDERRNLEFYSFDTRFRLQKGNFDFTLGAVARQHPVYHILPIQDFWVSGENTFNDLAEDFGYSTQYVQGNWHWFNNGELIATSNDEFYKHYFGEAIADYNQEQLDALGGVYELSAVVGVAYYKYTNEAWLHTWVNLMPLHYGLSEYSHEYNNAPLDVDAGIVSGWRITKHLGVFVEGTYLNYWEKPIYECKLGFNYLIF